MNYTLYSATGCTRCKIVKRLMEERGISYVERDMKAEGKEDFQKFYTANRKAVYRGPEGIEFPILTDGTKIRQGLGATVAYLHSGEKLDGFVSIGFLHKEWVDGLHVSGGNPEYARDFIEVLRYLKSNNMKLEIDTDGRNASILEQILDENLASTVVMNVLGPANLYSRIAGEPISLEEVERSIALVSKAPNHRFQTTVVPVVRSDGEMPEISYLTPAEIAETAQLISRITESNKQPYLIKPFRPQEAKDARLKTVEPLDDSALLSCRTAARRHLVLADVDKSSR